MEPGWRGNEQHEHAVATTGEYAATTGRDAATATATRLHRAAQHSAVDAVDGCRQQSATAAGSDAAHADTAARNGHTTVATEPAESYAPTAAGHCAATWFPGRLAAAADGRMAAGGPGTASAAATDSRTTWDRFEHVADVAGAAAATASAH